MPAAKKAQGSVLKEGRKAPAFALPSTEGKAIRLSDFKGKKNIVLYFYPKDNTPGCTAEACDFRDSLKRIQRKDTVVLGVSPDPVASHEKFREKYGLTFPLLSDEGKEMLRKYGVWKQKSLYGRKFMGVERTTVLIDKEGKIRKVFPKVKVKGHVDEILEALKEI